MKCYGDVFCPNADYVLHMDPDSLFSRSTTPEDYFIDNKPVLLIEPYEVLKTIHPARYNWKSVTEAALKFEVSHETMCRHPAVHHAKTYRGLRSYMESVHVTPFYDFVIKQKNQYPQGFGEFNTLGAYAMKFLPEEYRFIDRGNKGGENDPPPHVWQGWSYTGVSSPDNAKKIKEILG